MSGIVHVSAPRSNSSHVASRTSADRAAVSTWNSNASFAPAHPREAWTAAIAPATSRYGSAGMWRTFTGRFGSAAPMASPAGLSLR